MQSLRFGRFEVLTTERRLLVDGQPAIVGARAFDVLMALIERRDRVVSKGELLDTVWPRLVVEENNLQVQISALRKLLGPEVIATISGRGYRFATRLDSERQADVPAGTPPAPRDAPLVRTNLPERLPALYGREADLQALRALVEASPLVTIAGAGGIGKTRLAMALAHELRGRYADGVWMIELASLNDPALVLPTIAQALQVPLSAHQPPQAELIGALQTQSLLLLLDNCEHVLDVVSALAAGLVREAPGVHLLATSQELLRLPDEQLLRLAPLAVPEHRQAAQAADFGAVRLFVERVRALDTGFELTADNADAVIDICGQLDGIALAIELAAARVPLLGVEGIRDRLSERFRVLTGGARVSLRRHQTLRAALDWSHNLLGTDEQKVFRRLGVFAGGFTLDSAQRIAGDDTIDEWAVIDLLSGLVDKSLVLADGGPRPRYRLLETARSYAVEKLAEAGETDAWLRRHATTTQAVLERAVKRRDSELLAQEMNNVRAAFTWAASLHGDPSTAVALATASSVVLAVEGFVVEALERLLKVEPHVTGATPPAQAAQYWQWLGRLGIDGRLPVSRCIEALQRAEAMFREQGNTRHLHACLRMQAEARLETGQFAAAQTALDEARQMEHPAWPVADRMRRLRVQGLLLDMTGRPEESLATSEQAYWLAEADGIDRYVLILLSDMAGVHLKLGHAEEAAERFRALAGKARHRAANGLTLCYALAGLTAALIAQDHLAEAREVANEAMPLLRRSGIFLARSDIFAWLAAREGDLVTAAKLVGAADAFRRRSESSRDQVEQRIRDEVVQQLQAAHPPPCVAQWMAEGASLEEEALVRLMA
ncbi:ATP-binding protein [Piscinibacter sp.]|uniref:ATP-binding protein n=1 Tax=Piscinibacter sp. TaxID=1903157 RepID=UPI002BD5B9F9|nr:winged helix-turn-helix domain-containing protein [Albitalea sp.]HUG21491.1 winged helix-turn-helix domain-containing protein [Albitalea sp.]